MKYLFFLLFASGCFFSCGDSRDKMLFPVNYDWKDSVLDYQLTRGELTLTFLHETKDTSWIIETELLDPDSSFRMIYYAEPKSYPVKNNQIHIPVSFSENKDPQKLKPWIRGFPNIGTYYSPYKKGFTLEGMPVFVAPDNHLHLFRKAATGHWRLLPDSALKGKDSEYYKERAERFFRDSTNMWGRHR